MTYYDDFTLSAALLEQLSTQGLGRAGRVGSLVRTQSPLADVSAKPVSMRPVRGADDSHDRAAECGAA